MKRFMMIAGFVALTAGMLMSLSSALCAQDKITNEQRTLTGDREKEMTPDQVKATAEEKKPMTPPGVQMALMKSDLQLAMRKLWEEHIFYTRNYTISAIAGLGDANVVAERLLRNQDDIGNAIKPFYGEEAGKKLTSLLRAHIMIATEVIKAAKANDTAGLGKSQADWIANADEIAAFLSGANPHWKRAALEEILHMHLDHNTAQCVARLKMDWAADIKSFDEGHATILTLADELAKGIEQQFPEKFKK